MLSGRAQPVHAPAAIAQRLRHGQSREDVTAGAASHDAQRWLIPAPHA
jgi:hypothetical protein